MANPLVSPDQPFHYHTGHVTSAATRAQLTNTMTITSALDVENASPLATGAQRSHTMPSASAPHNKGASAPAVVEAQLPIPTPDASPSQVQGAAAPTTATEAQLSHTTPKASALHTATTNLQSSCSVESIRITLKITRTPSRRCCDLHTRRSFTTGSSSSSGPSRSKARVKSLTLLGRASIGTKS